MNTNSNEVFTIGPHRHLCGDSTDTSNLEQLMQGKKAQLLLADPPYCLLTRRNKKGQLRDPKKAKINHEAVTRYENIKQYREFTQSWLSLAVKHLDEQATLCIWTNFLGKEPITTVAKDLGYEYFYGEFNWVKLTKEGGGNEKLARLYEVCLVFSKVPAKKVDPTDPPQCWSVVGNYDDDGEAGDWENHPNHKSYNIIEPLIRAYSKPNELVLDPFTGSGSTPAACIKLHRIIAGLELREKWAMLSQERLKHVFQHS